MSGIEYIRALSLLLLVCVSSPNLPFLVQDTIPLLLSKTRDAFPYVEELRARLVNGDNHNAVPSSQLC